MLQGDSSSGNGPMFGPAGAASSARALKGTMVARSAEPITRPHRALCQGCIRRIRRLRIDLSSTSRNARLLAEAVSLAWSVHCPHPRIKKDAVENVPRASGKNPDQLKIVASACFGDGSVELDDLAVDQ
jgi:hypothetical protein